MRMDGPQIVKSLGPPHLSGRDITVAPNAYELAGPSRETWR